jgi:DNA-binding winged helix-turn-helix (wHTH) protein/TolB-like protein
METTMQHEKIATPFVNGHRLDLVNGTLTHKDINVPIRPKSFALLRYLVLNSGRVISKDEFFDAVWGNIAVTDDALTQTIRDVRRAIADTDNRVLRTVAKRGYMLTVERDALIPENADHRDRTQGQERILKALVCESVSAQPMCDGDNGAGSHAEPHDQPPKVGHRASGRSRPGVVVLPFKLPDGDAERLMHIRNGLLRDISGQLLKLQSLFVIDANSSEALVDSTLNWLEAGKLLQCDYVCTGTLEESDDKLHLTIEMNAIDDGRLLLSERLSRPVGDASQVGGELASEIARNIESEIEITERNRTFLLQPFELDSWQAFHRGMWHMMRFNREDVLRSVAFFNLSIARDPTFSRAYSALAFTHWLNAYLGSDNLEEENRLAYDLAVRATMIGPREPCGHCSVGRSLWISGAVDEALETFSRATAMSPNNVVSNFSWGYVEACSGNAELAIELLDRARSISPFDPFLSSIRGGRAIALLRLGRVSEAADWGLRAAQHPFAHNHILTASALTLTAAKRHAEAERIVRRIKSDRADASAETMIRISSFKPDDAKMVRELARECDFV